MFSEDEKKVLKKLVEEEIKEVEKEGSTILKRYPDVVFLKGEEKYGDFLKGILDKM